MGSALMQTKKGSIFEVCCNVGSGIVVSMCLWNFLIVPLLAGGYDYFSLKGNFMITITFTVVSIFRGYIWRRMFNWLEGKEQKERKRCLANTK